MQLNEYLSQFITQRRQSLIDHILEDRTNYITVVAEDIFQPQNASAILRSCDCFGIQNVHIIENKNRYEVNPKVVLGASKWITLNQYRGEGETKSTTGALMKLKENGYRIVATSPHKPESQLENFDLSKGKTALIFGTEQDGISEDVHSMADEYIHIPMYGFTESLNISVSAAIIIQHLSHKLRHSAIDWRLSDEEKSTLKLEWLKRSIPYLDKHLSNFNLKYNQSAG